MKPKTITPIIVAATLVTFTGCSGKKWEMLGESYNARSSIVGTGGSNPVKNKGTVYVYRVRRFQSRYLTPAVRVDGHWDLESERDILNGGFIALELDSGPHTLEFLNHRTEYPYEPEPSSTFDRARVVEPGSFLFNRPTVVVVPSNWEPPKPTDVSDKPHWGFTEGGFFCFDRVNLEVKPNQEYYVELRYHNLFAAGCFHAELVEKNKALQSLKKTKEIVPKVTFVRAPD